MNSAKFICKPLINKTIYLLLATSSSELWLTLYNLQVDIYDVMIENLLVCCWQCDCRMLMGSEVRYQWVTRLRSAAAAATDTAYLCTDTNCHSLPSHISLLSSQLIHSLKNKPDSLFAIINQGQWWVLNINYQ